ncbi:MAG: carboxypeptidase-like regulatory domain-containing protein [Planctomycetaceae bacterium]|jgi:hypothetical protein|nr:carboxypeptidase-like regulatory domain-containing protein [Planctomycetaceae bacterium]
MRTTKIFLLVVVLFVLVFGSRLTADEVAVNGTVFDESGKPVEGAQVCIKNYFGNREITGITGNNGRYSLLTPSGIVSPWTGVYAVSPDKKQIGSAHIKLEEGNPKITDTSITLEPARIITGNVTDPDGKPIEGVLVAGVDQTVYPNFARTDKNGDFSFAYPKDDFVLLQEVVAFLENVGMDYVCTDELEKYRGKIPPEKIKNDNFQLKLSKFDSYKFQVTDEAGTLLAGVKISPFLIKKENTSDVFNTSSFSSCPQALTGVDGTAVVQAIGKTTRFYVDCPDEGIAMPDGSRSFLASTDERWDKFDSSKPIATFVLKRRGRVNGSVRLADGTPVAWSRITIKHHIGCGHGVRWTDQNGEFTYERGQTNELFDIGVESKLGAAAGVFGFNVGNGIEEKRLDFVLDKGVRLHGTIYKPDKTPAENYQIFIYENCPEDILTKITKPIAGKDDATCPPDGCPTGIVIRQQSDYQKPNSQGKYEYLLPTVPRKYKIIVSLNLDPDLLFVLDDYEVKGDEKEILLDFHLKPREKKSN